MYVCICNAITEREVRRAAVVEGHRTAMELFASRHIGPVCGSCLDEMDDLLARCAREADDRAEGELRVLG